MPPIRPSRGSDPYCAFKDDRHRLWALVARDVRNVAIVGLVLVGMGHVPPAVVARLLAFVV
jgi:hypothetical protein